MHSVERDDSLAVHKVNNRFQIVSISYIRFEIGRNLKLSILVFVNADLCCYCVNFQIQTISGGVVSNWIAYRFDAMLKLAILNFLLYVRLQQSLSRMLWLCTTLFSRSRSTVIMVNWLPGRTFRGRSGYIMAIVISCPFHPFIFAIFSCKTFNFIAKNLQKCTDIYFIQGSSEMLQFIPSPVLRLEAGNFLPDYVKIVQQNPRENASVIPGGSKIYAVFKTFECDPCTGVFWKSAGLSDGSHCSNLPVACDPEEGRRRNDGKGSFPSKAEFLFRKCQDHFAVCVINLFRKSYNLVKDFLRSSGEPAVACIVIH